MVRSDRKFSWGCSRCTRRNQGARAAPREQKWECGVLVPSAPWKGWPCTCAGRRGRLCPTSRIQEVGARVAPPARKKGLISGHPGREARVACGVGPCVRKKGELVPCSVGRKGGPHTAGARGGLSGMCRNGCARAAWAGTGFRASRFGEMDGGLIPGGKRKRARGTPLAQDVGARAAGGWGAPRAQEERRRSLQRGQTGVAPRLQVDTAPTGMGVQRQWGHAPLAPEEGLVPRPRALGSLPP